VDERRPADAIAVALIDLLERETAISTFPRRTGTATSLIRGVLNDVMRCGGNWFWFASTRWDHRPGVLGR
jgi:hypothetical protein